MSLLSTPSIACHRAVCNDRALRPSVTQQVFRKSHFFCVRSSRRKGTYLIPERAFARGS